MTQVAAPRRGAPLLMLGTVVMTWAIYRAMVWDAPMFPSSQSVADNTASSLDRGMLEAPVQPARSTRQEPFTLAVVDVYRRTADAWKSSFSSSASQSRGSSATSRGGYLAGRVADNALAHIEILPSTSRSAPAIQTGEPGLVARSTSHIFPPSMLASNYQTAEPVATSAANADRWSGDAWALFRGGKSAAPGLLQPSYGRSQAGAVLRYDLAPASASRPQIYVRGRTAIEGPSEREIGAGASVRPLAAVPLRLHAEGRIFDTHFGTETRAAAFVVTELPPARLPAGFIAETYGQAGYVTGRFATPFVDGQVRVMRPVVEQSGYSIRAGAGAWGGAQEGTERLDVGPTVAVTVPIGTVNARVAVDYRFRVAGDAEPSSGPALTLSAGF